MPRQSSRLKKAVEGATTTAVKATKQGAAEVAAEVKSLSLAGAKKRKAKKDEEEDGDGEVTAAEEPKPAKKRKTAKAKTENLMALAKRTVISTLKKPMYIGAHVSSAGGVHNSINNAVHIGANAFALFLKSQRKWKNPQIAPEAREGFLSLSKEHEYEVHKHCLPHGSYLVNLAQWWDDDKADQAYDSFLDDLLRCESLGIRLYNFHPGNTGGEEKYHGIKQIAQQLNKAHKATSRVVTVLENMAGQGNVIGSTFEDLRDIIDRVHDKSRVGVCIDTCHAFAAGYDLRTPEAFKSTMDSFNAIVGHEFLMAFHLNDSKAPLSSRRDLHANIGTGFLGLRAFHNIVNHEPFQGLPMILETPIDRKGPDGKTFEDKQVWADEIKLLESLIGMDPDGEEFAALDKRLQAQGAAERAKIQDQVERKSVKDAKKAAPKKAAPKKRGKKNAEPSDEEESD